ncbi:MAG: hypothetical protein M3443_04205 [Actinomycetota bacterium]|nr:hypothetical protein [Actinomycetota bacterium]
MDLEPIIAILVSALGVDVLGVVAQIVGGEVFGDGVADHAAHVGHDHARRLDLVDVPWNVDVEDLFGDLDVFVQLRVQEITGMGGPGVQSL